MDDRRRSYPSGQRRPGQRRRTSSPKDGESAGRTRGGNRVRAPRSGDGREIPGYKGIWVVFAIVVLAIIGQLFNICVIKADEYNAMAKESRTANITTTPRRGTIYDCNGNILAISVDATTIYCNPTKVTDAQGAAAKLASLLGGEEDYYYQQLTTEDATFAYIEKQVDVDKAEEVEALGLDGIEFLDDTRREYPYGETGGQVIGMVSEVEEADGTHAWHGVCGLEAYYDDILCGTPGTYEAEIAYVEQTVDGGDGSTVTRRIAIPGRLKEEVKAVDGQDIIISIDIELQAQVEEKLVAANTQYEGESSSCIIMEAGTGEIRAAASLPLFNPADPSESEVGSDYVKAITTATEPGSIYKTVGALAILESGTMTPDTEIFCPAEIEADGYVVSDAHERDDTTMTLRDIIDNSSNVGISLSVENMGFDKFYQALSRYKLDEYTGVDYPGESAGYTPDFNTWGKITGYNATFGQGLSVTPLQMVRFYGALINDGVEVTPHFLVRNLATGQGFEGVEVQVVENTDAIDDMVDMLRTVVTSGTGKKAAIEGYDIAGKTSTAEIPTEDGSGYLDDYYNLAFLGFVANSTSDLVCYVGATHVYYDTTVAPVFKDIMTYAIDRYRIIPY